MSLKANNLCFLCNNLTTKNGRGSTPRW